MVWTEKGLVPAGVDRTKQEVENECYNGSGRFCLKLVKDNGWSIPDKLWKK